MAWVRIDDEMAQHPKMLRAGPLGIAMQVSALCYCNRYLTDGFVPDDALDNLLNLSDFEQSPPEIVNRLVAVGAWSAVDGGYQIHDYLEYQPPKTDIERKREQSKARQEKLRERRRNAAVTKASRRSNAAVTQESRESNAVTSAVTSASPEGVTQEATRDFADPVPVPEGQYGYVGAASPSAAPAGPNGPEPLAAAASFVDQFFDDYPNLDDLRSELLDRKWPPNGDRLTVDQADALISAEQENRSW